MEVITNISTDKAEEAISRLSEDVRHHLIDNFQLSISTECTGFIYRCLRIKDYDVEKAAKLVRNFAKSTHALHDILEKFQPKFYKDLFMNGVFTVLNTRDQFGRQVIISRVGRWDPKAFDFDEAACAAMLLFSYTVGLSAETQRKGIVFVHDLSGFGMQHVKAIKPGRLTRLIDLMQDGSPGRIKGIHMIFHPKIFGLIYQLVKPFLREKLSKRVHFHGDDLTSLHKHLGMEILPKSLGGLKPEADCVDLPLLNKLICEQTIHKEMMNYGCPTY
jgi:retinaldehyde-binding protein 1